MKQFQHRQLRQFAAESIVDKFQWQRPIQLDESSHNLVHETQHIGSRTLIEFIV